jgi:hypothetical protein
MQETTRTNSEDDRVENVESSLQDTPYIHANIYTGSVAPSPTRLKSAPVAVVAVVAADVVAAAIATDIAAVPNSCNPVRSGLPRTASRIRLRRSEAPPSQADHNELRGVGRIPVVNASLELFYDTTLSFTMVRTGSTALTLSVSRHQVIKPEIGAASSRHSTWWFQKKPPTLTIQDMAKYGTALAIHSCATVLEALHSFSHKMPECMVCQEPYTELHPLRHIKCNVHRYCEDYFCRAVELAIGDEACHPVTCGKKEYPRLDFQDIRAALLRYTTIATSRQDDLLLHYARRLIEYNATNRMYCSKADCTTA